VKLTERISSIHPGPGELALFYLAQAGFYFKTTTGKTLCIDAYTGDCCERFFNFKRMVPAPMAASELRADLFVSTHSHNDHLDPDLLDVVKQDPRARFVGAPDCLPAFRDAGLPDDRVTIIATGESATVDGIVFRGIYADHGDLAPDAIGLLMDLDGILVYDTGDTAYCPDEIMASLAGADIDILIAPINPAFGNLGHENAAKLAAVIKPRVVIGSHFGMFIEHGGDPGAFLEYAKQTLPETITPVIMAPGERMTYSKQQGVKEMETQKMGIG
jgi:L-ascorbate 6-phosphate lactonase